MYAAIMEHCWAAIETRPRPRRQRPDRVCDQHIKKTQNFGGSYQYRTSNVWKAWLMLLQSWKSVQCGFLGFSLECSPFYQNCIYGRIKSFRGLWNATTSSMGDHVRIRCHMAFVAQTCPGSQSKWNCLMKSLAGQIHDPDQTQCWQDLP